MRPRLTVVAHGTGNRRGEIEAALAAWAVEVRSAHEVLGTKRPLPQDGPDLRAVALARARDLAESTLHVAFGHATGLQVEALGGRPGVRSARLAGEGATDADNNAELLRLLDDVDGEHRRAHYRAVIAVVDPWADGEPLVAEGLCEGRIARKPSGVGGFGYDALFLPEDQTVTLGELSPEARRPLSHFGRALAALLPALAPLFDARVGRAAEVVGAGAAKR